MKKPKLLTILIKFYSFHWLRFLSLPIRLFSFHVTKTYVTIKFGSNKQKKEPSEKPTPRSLQNLQQTPAEKELKKHLADKYAPPIEELPIIRTYFVYILRSLKDKKFYIGTTDDLHGCYKRHNTGQNPTTFDRMPFELIYYEAFMNFYDAKTRERYLRSDAGHRFLKKHLQHFFQSKSPGRVKRILKITSFISVQILVILIPTLVAIFYTPSSSIAAWFDEGWAYRRSLTITHNAVVTNNKLKFDIDTQTLITNNQMQSDCGDSRFTDGNGNLLPYFIDTSGGACNGNSTDYYVLIPVINNGTTIIYHYYGNPTSTNGTAGSQLPYTTLSPSGGAASSGSEEKSPGPISYWKFDEGSDNTCPGGTNDVCDSMPRKYDGAISGASWRSEDLCVSGKCLEFDGSDDTVNIGNQPLLNFERTNPFSVSLWIKTTSDQGMTLISKQVNSAPYQGWNIQTGAGGYIFFQLVNTYSSNALESRTTNDTNYDDGRWHHILATYDGTSANAGVRIYIDGVNQSLTSTITGLSSTLQNSTDIHIGSRNGAEQRFNGFIDEVKVYNYVRTATQSKADYIARGTKQGTAVQLGQPSTNFLNNGLVGYWPMDETSANSCSGGANDNCDKSGNGLDGAWNGNTGYTGGKFGGGSSHDGTGDYVGITNNALLQFTSNQSFSVATWVYVPSLPNAWDAIVAKSRDSGNYYGIWISDENEWVFGETNNNDIVGPTVTTGWHHVVITQTANTKREMYVDGSSVGTLNTAYDANGSGNLLFGRGAGSSEDFTGTIDEVRIYNRDLSASEVKQLYNWAPGPVGYWKMDENNGLSIYDLTGNNGTGTLTNDPTWKPGKFGSGVKLDGVNDYIIVDTTTTHNFIDSQPHTYAAWVYPESVNGSLQLITDKQQNVTGEFYSVLYIDTTNVFGYVVGAQNTSGDIALSPTTILPNRWYYISGTSDNSRVRLYVNGIEVANVAKTFTATASTADFYIGQAYNNTGRFKGIVDDVKIYNYARTPSQIVEDMNGGHPAGGSPVGSQALYWKFDEGFGTTANSAVSGKQNGTLGNMASPATATSGWNLSGKINNSLTFDGSNDVVTLATASDADVDFNASEPFSLSSWIYVTTMPGSGERDLIVGKWEDDASPQRAYRLTVTNDDADTTGNLRAEVYDESADTMIGAATANDTISTNTWYHALMSFSGCTSSCPTSTVKVYLNGQDKGSSVTSGTFAGLEDMTADFTVGEYDTNDNAATDTPFTGRIDDVQVFSSELSSDSVQIVYNMNNAVNFGVGAPTPEPAQLADGAGNPPVGWWSFDENTGTSAFDKSGNGNTGTINSSLSYKPGKLGSAIFIPPSPGNEEVNITQSSTINDLPALTAEAWTYAFSAGGSSIGRIIVKGNNSSNGWFVRTSSAQSVRFQAYFNGGTNLVAETDSNTLPLNRWNHVAVTWDGSSSASNVSIYINGVLTPLSTTTNGVGTRDSDATQNLFIGNSNASQYWDGLLDEVKLYDYVRTPAQVAYDYNRGAPIAWWKFDECQGSTVYDATGRGNNGTITPGGSGNTAVGTCTSGTSTHMWNNGVAGKFNSSLDFDGSDDYVSLGDLSYAEGVSQLSWSVWVKPATAVNACILCKYNASAIANESWRIYADSTPANLLIGISANSTDTLAYGTVANVFSNGTWTHVVGVYDGTQSGNANRLKIYINGKPATVTFNSTIPASLQSNSTNIRIGASNDSIDNYDGLIDEVQMYNYPLSATQVLKIYNDNSSVFFGPSTGSP